MNRKWWFVFLVFAMMACKSNSEIIAPSLLADVSPTATQKAMKTSTVTEIPKVVPTSTEVLTPLPDLGCGRQVLWRSIEAGVPVNSLLSKKINTENWMMPLNYKDVKKGDILDVTFFPSSVSNDNRGLVQVFYYDKSENKHTYLAEQNSGKPPRIAMFKLVADYDLEWGDFYYFSVKRELGTPCNVYWNYVLDVRLNP